MFPISAKTGLGSRLVEHVVSLLPEGPFLYPADEQKDQDERVRLAELVREQVLRRTREELPHAVEVEVARWPSARTACWWSRPASGPRASPRRGS